MHQGELQQEELFVAVEMLSAVALINQALEEGHLQQFGSLLISPAAGLSDVDPTLLDRYNTSSYDHYLLVSHQQTTNGVLVCEVRHRSTNNTLDKNHLFTCGL